MKKNLLTIILSVVCGLSIVCSVVSLSVGLSHINDTTINEKVEVIESTLDDLEALDTTLDNRIVSLESKVTTLESELEEKNTTIDALESDFKSLQETKETLEYDITSIKVDIESLKSKDTELEGKITTLETTLNSSVEDVKEWVETNYATIESCEDLEEEIRELITSLDSRVSALESSVNTLNGAVEALEEQVNQNKEKIEELENRINCLEGNHAFEVSYKWADDYSACTATQVCQRNCGFENELSATSITVSGTKITATFNGAESTSVDITTIENQDYIVAMGENSNSTYVIYNKAGLDAWKNAATTDASTNLTLACDIEYNASWSKLNITYTGTIDGNGYAIKGLNSSEENAAFIQKIGSAGVVKHLGITGGSFHNTTTRVGCGSAAICFQNDGVIIGCYNTSSVTSAGNSGDVGGGAGGLVGFNYGQLVGCFNSGTVQAGGNYGGGIAMAAATGSKIVSCYNTGSVSGKNYSVGAIVGWIRGSSVISDCYYTRPSSAIGYTEKGTATNLTQVTGSDWTTPMNTMNAAIEEYNKTATVKCNYRYALNTDAATKGTQPLIIVEVAE